MAGVLFIVTIPSEEEESRQNPRESSSDGDDDTSTTSVSLSTENVELSEHSLVREESLPQNVSKQDFIAIDINEPSTSKSNQKIVSDEKEIAAQIKTDEYGEGTKPGPRSKFERKLTKKSWTGLKNIVSPKKKVKISHLEGDIGSFLKLTDDASMECIMGELLKKLKVEDATWQLTKNSNYYQITFAIGPSHRQELILNTLSEWGIGERNGSSVSVLPCSIYSQSSPSENRETNPEAEKISKQNQTAWDRFMNSVRARWNVAQIVEKVKADATTTFDFVTLTLIAGLLAALGFVENNATLLVSSMLISPLMGPILASIFGIVIKDKALIRFGIRNELIGLSMAVIVGFIFAIIICSIDSRYASSVHGPDSALTEEMKSRCDFHSLLVGMFTALASGAAAAIGILGGNIGSLVGVAVSASLLPPAVNAGALWALAVLYKYYEKNESLYGTVITSNYYSNDQSLELAVHASISMLLTIVNIICILFTGVLVLKIKEVAPITLRNRQLWKHDVKVARNYNTSGSPGDDESNEELLRQMGSRSFERQWSASKNVPKRRKTSVGDLENFYRQLAVPRSQIEHWNRTVGVGYGSSMTFAGDHWGLPTYQSLFDHNIFEANNMTKQTSMAYPINMEPYSNLPSASKHNQLEEIVEHNSTLSSPLLKDNSNRINGTKPKISQKFHVLRTNSFGSRKNETKTVNS